MPHPLIIDPTQNYTFSRYFELTADPEEIFAEFDCQLVSRSLVLPEINQPLDFVAALAERLDRVLELVDLTSEIARREKV